MQLKYHQATYDLLIQNRVHPKNFTQEFEKNLSLSRANSMGRRAQLARYSRWLLRWQNFNQNIDTPAFSDKQIRQLNDLERRFSIVFPASVREWYSLNFVPDLMALYWLTLDSNRKPIHKFRPFPARQGNASNHYHLWEFTYHEFIGQGIQRVGFDTNVEFDPSVFIEANTAMKIAPLFSEFIFLLIWDWLTKYKFRYGFELREDPDLPPNYDLLSNHRVSLTKLRQRYQEQSDKLRLRFYDKTTRIKAWPYAQWNLGNSTWQIIDSDRIGRGEFYTESAEQLRQLIADLWGENPPIFHMSNYTHEASREILKEKQLKGILEALAHIDEWINSVQLAELLKYSSFDLWYDLNTLVDKGHVEAHPDNDSLMQNDHRYRLKYSSS